MRKPQIGDVLRSVLGFEWEVVDVQVGYLEVRRNGVLATWKTDEDGLPNNGAHLLKVAAARTIEDAAAVPKREPLVEKMKRERAEKAAPITVADLVKAAAPPAAIPPALPCPFCKHELHVAHTVKVMRCEVCGWAGTEIKEVVPEAKFKVGDRVTAARYGYGQVCTAVYMTGAWLYTVAIVGRTEERRVCLEKEMVSR